MAKLFLNTIRTSKEHIIFSGRNALHHAIFFDENGRIATADDLYMRRFEIEECCSWGIGKARTANIVKGTNVIGDGVHAKMYTLKSGSIIYSSQNNGSSALYEFAILYQKPGKELKSFTSVMLERGKEFSSWWKRNNKWMSK